MAGFELNRTEKIDTFHSKRRMFFINENSLIQFANASYNGKTHAEWFSKEGIPFIDKMRGYHYEDENESFLMLYTNNFDIPSRLAMGMISYFFEYFPKISWIGMGAIPSKTETIWKPQIKIFKENVQI